MSKTDPIPGKFASGGVLLIDSPSDPRFQGHNGTCTRCGKSLWMHEKVRVYPDDGPPGSWHHSLLCPDEADVKEEL